MPTAVAERPALAEGVVTRKQWTRDEFDAFAATGLWGNPKDNLELIGGDLLNKVPKNRLHTNQMILILNWLVQVFGVQFVNPEAPIAVAPNETATNRPEPDLIVLNRPSREIRDRDPLPGELRLAVEISNSSLNFDLTVKADLYARAGIVEYWVVDSAARRVIVHRNPSNGLYQDIQSYSSNESVSSLAAPDAALSLAELFID